jgi:predicted nucleic acid-binding Zn ribbon protein
MSLEPDRPARPDHGGAKSAGAQSIGRLVSRLLARTGYDQEQSSQRLATAWAEVVPAALARLSRPGRVRRGVLELLVSHSAAAQEMGYHKADLIRRLAEVLPDETITDIRCRLAAGFDGRDAPGAVDAAPHHGTPDPHSHQA